MAFNELDEFGKWADDHGGEYILANLRLGEGPTRFRSGEIPRGTVPDPVDPLYTRIRDNRLSVI